MYKRQSGFTLVEIAIVLVIIGLLLGGVLKGQEMIANAKFKNLQKDVQSYAAAIYSFQDRFKALPGDMTTVAAAAQLNSAALGGNGNGVIGNGNNQICGGAASEPCRLWQHLRYANLIPGDPALTGTAANPIHAYGGQIQGAFGGTNGTRTGIWIQLQNLPGDVAQRLDRELDDGAADAGTVFCFNGCTGAAYPTDGSNVQLRVMI